MTTANDLGPWPELRIDVGRLRQRDDLALLKRRGESNASRPVDVEVEAHGMAVTTAGIPDGEPVKVIGVIDSALSGVEFAGRVESRWEGECRRCLDVVAEPINVELAVSFLPDLREDDDADAYPIQGDFVDLGEVVREELMLALPLSPLCTDGCGGADPDRYPTAAAGDPESGASDEEEGERSIDPRWAGLSALTFDED